MKTTTLLVAAMALIIATMMMINVHSAQVHPRGNQNYTPEALVDEITNLPDAEQLPQRQFGGYIDINNNTHHLYYWFVEAESNPQTAPLIFWTNGGPGCSGLIGKLTEMGPYTPVKDGNKVKLVRRDVTWNTDFNIIYIEQPVGSFSYAEPGYEVREWTDSLVARNNANFMEEWFKRFPQYKVNDFGIASESYGGHYIPTLARELISRVNSGRMGDLKFKWSMVGNPLIYLPTDDSSAMVSLINRQLIPTYPYGQEYKQKCLPDNKVFPNPPAERDPVCSQLEHTFATYTSRLDPYAMSFPICVQNGKVKASGNRYGEHILKMKARAQSTYRDFTYEDILARHQEIYDQHQKVKELNGLLGNDSDEYFPANYNECSDDQTAVYLSRSDVQRAIHAKAAKGDWEMCTDILYNNFDFIDCMLPVFVDNAKNGPYVKQLIYSGTDDTVCSTPEAQNILFNNLQPISMWDDIVSNKGQQIGFKSLFSIFDTEFTFATVSNAGHMVPSTSPSHARQMITRFVNGKF